MWALFSPEILQAVAVKGLILRRHTKSNSLVCWFCTSALGLVLFQIVMLRLNPSGKLGSPYLGKAALKSSATRSFQCVSITCVPTMVWLPVIAICNCSAHRCWSMRLNTEVYEHFSSLTWELALGDKSLASSGNRTLVSIAPGVSVHRCTNWVTSSLPPPPPPPPPPSPFL